MAYKKVIYLGLDYSEFEGGIKRCNEQMKNLDAEFKLAQSQMENTGKSSEKLALREEYLTQKIFLQQQKVEEAKKKYNALMDAHADTSKIDAADCALLNERTTLQNLQNELDNTRIKASGLKESMTTLTAVVTSLSAVYLGTSKSVADYADNIITLSNVTHIATDTLQGWEYAADLIDVSVDTMTGSIRKMTNNMQTAATGSGEVSKAFTKLGVKITDTHGRMRDSEEVFYDVIDALVKVKNETERDQLAMDIFGKSATELAGAISAGSDGLKEYGDKARELGLIMSDEALATAVEYKDALDKLDSTFEAMKNNLGMVLIPILTELVNAIASIPAPVLSTIVVILSIVATLVSLTSAVNSVIKTGKSIGDLFTMVTKGLDTTYIKITLLILGITALVSAIAVLIGRGKEVNDTMSNLGNLGGTNRFQPAHNARGTNSFVGGATWVGEEGPELVNLPPGTRIYSNWESRQIAGGNTYYINMNMDITKLKTVNDVVEAVTGLANSSGSGGIIHV